MDLIPTVAEKYDISVIAGTHRSINDNNTHSLRAYILKIKNLLSLKRLLSLFMTELVQEMLLQVVLYMVS